MSRTLAAIRIAAVAGVALSPAPGLAQTGRACAARTQVVDRLAERFGETLQSLGVDDKGGLIEVYASAESGTWTILATSPDGASCLVASGRSWEGPAASRKPGRDA